MSEDDTQIWKIVRESLKTAPKALDRCSDEREWTNVVSSLLQQTMGTNDQEGGLLEAMHIQNVPIGLPSLIPTVGDEPLAFKKVDLAVVFSDSEPDLDMLCTKAMKKNAALELSQSEDGTLGGFCQFAAIAIKSPDGSYYKASVQLGIWLAAGLEKSRQLRELAATKNQAPATQTQEASQEEYLLPYVGISVHGHVWNLHLAWKGLDGAVQIYGPLVIGDTSTTKGIFRIVAALKHLKTWGEEVYYPWLLKEILLPLAEEDESSLVGQSTASALEEVEGEHETSGSNVKGKGKQRV